MSSRTRWVSGKKNTKIKKRFTGKMGKRYRDNEDAAEVDCDQRDSPGPREKEETAA